MANIYCLYEKQPVIHTYTNMIPIIANRKKAKPLKMGGGPTPPPPPLTEAEDMVLSQDRGRPVAEGIPGGSSSVPAKHRGLDKR